MIGWRDRWTGPSLSHLPDEEVLVLARSGDRLAVEHLLGRYRGLVENKARLYFLSGADHEDVVQEGMIGLLKAIRDYRSERLVRFRAFAELCITRQIISAVKSATRRKHLPLNQYVPLHRPIGDDDAALVDIVADHRPGESEAAVLTRRLTDYLEQYAATELSDLENQVLRSRLEGKSYQQMAMELKCRPKCVDNALQRAKRKIWSRIATAAD
jgi:RNA polymerase sporulation-specific sigma factor